MQFFGLRMAGVTSLCFGGLSASFFLAGSALIQWVLAQDGIAVSGVAAHALHHLAFATGASDTSFRCGLCSPPISVTAGVRRGGLALDDGLRHRGLPHRRAVLSGWYFQPRWSCCRWPFPRAVWIVLRRRDASRLDRARRAMTANGALQGKVSLVLGASKGIGAGTARAFGRAGATVASHLATNRPG